MNITCPFHTWPYSCILLHNIEINYFVGTCFCFSKVPRIFPYACQKHWILGNKNNINSNNDNIITPHTHKKKRVLKRYRIICSKQCRQPPTVSLTFVNDKTPFFSILCQSSFWKPIFRVCSFLDVLFLCRINMDNRILLVSFVNLSKTTFTISLSELRVEHGFVLLEMNIFLFQLEFSTVESTKAFTESTDPTNCFSWLGKRVQ